MPEPGGNGSAAAPSAAPLASSDRILLGAFDDVVAAATRRVGPISGILLAVSGGPDSLALLLAASAWRQSLGCAAPQLGVATVDHRLRPASTDEAAFVAATAAGHGLPHETLTWTPEARSGNLSARAREARYALLLSHARRHGLDLVLTAHHLDDDIETHVIRRQNGGDFAAAAGMRSLRGLGPDVWLGRPFLDIGRDKLVAVAAAAGIVAVDDPSNRDRRYDRARIRLDLAEDPRLRARALGNLRRCKRARGSAERALASLIAGLDSSKRLVFAEDGAIRVQRAVCSDLPQRCAAHLLSRAIVAAAGASSPPSGHAVREVLIWLRKKTSQETARTLGGTVISIEGGDAVFKREFGRGGIAALPIVSAEALSGRFAAGMEWPIVYDGRFVVDAGPWRSVPGARIVPLGLLGKGGARLRACPVVIDADGVPCAALAPAARRLGPGVADLVSRPLAPHLFWRDLDFSRSLTASTP
ncbi:tRNA lysidine(34) synthetase TilS [Jiella pelagia]|uniref:tRNA(Ile)-lysidine synthase n=1 Tax=Jiella pelagia TaxID=2986949 RepID=A0ABY7BVA5_9HYPH|nr:tRNA lysidine(34) synthetase TilS [Jiella pelagia]WAP67331.1 tRNA lysidine(34) synthetase TilS [Jiella pelagia]